MDATGLAAIGRAGSSVVATDDGTALTLNPAGLARRRSWRAQLGWVWSHHHARYRSNLDFSPDKAPTVDDQTGPLIEPWLGIQGAAFDTTVWGVAYLAPTVLSISSAAPATYESPVASDRTRHPQRYAGTNFSLSRRGIAIGAATQLRPWLAIGGAGFALAAHLAQDRTLWGGTPDDCPTLFDPACDLGFSAEAKDDFVPGASAGMIVAPENMPVEFGLSLVMTAPADLVGTVYIKNSRGPDPTAPYVRATVDPNARAHLTFTWPLLLRAGARLYLRKVAVELDGEWRHQPTTTPLWTLDGVMLSRQGQKQPLTTVPLGVGFRRSSYAVRAAADVDLLPQFLWLHTGYAYTQSPVAPTQLSFALPLLATHVFALGVEVRVRDTTLTLGFSHAIGVSKDVPRDQSTVLQVAPFDSTLRPIGGGRYDAAETLIGMGIEIEMR